MRFTARETKQRSERGNSARRINGTGRGRITILEEQQALVLPLGSSFLFLLLHLTRFDEESGARFLASELERIPVAF